MTLLAILCLCAGCCLTSDSNVPPIPMVAGDGASVAIMTFLMGKNWGRAVPYAQRVDAAGNPLWARVR